MFAVKRSPQEKRPRGQPLKLTRLSCHNTKTVLTIPDLKKKTQNFGKFVVQLAEEENKDSSLSSTLQTRSESRKGCFDRSKPCLQPPQLPFVNTTSLSNSSNPSLHQPSGADNLTMKSKSTNISPHLQQRYQEREYEEGGQHSLADNPLRHSRSAFTSKSSQRTYAGKSSSRSERILARHLQTSQENPLVKASSSRNINFTSPSNPVSRVKQHVNFSKMFASIDLTNESDDEIPPATIVDCPSRQDLLEVTGSISTAIDLTDMEDPSFSGQSACVVECQTKLNGNICDFLKKCWVGQDKAVLLKNKSNADQERIPTSLMRGQSVMGTISASGIGSYALTAKDLACLDGSEWLNDEVVNAYMCLLQIRSNLNSNLDSVPCSACSEDKQNNLPKCLFFNSFFYALLRNARGGYSYSNVQRWGRRYNLFEMDRVFLPINISNSHWCLAVVFPQEWKIKYYDSMGGKNSVCLDLIERYLQDEGRHRSIHQLTRSWDKESVGPPSIPAQVDGCSCGVFVCAFADCLSAGQSPQGFSQRDMPAIRQHIRQHFISCRL